MARGSRWLCVELNLEWLDLAGAFQVMELGEVRVLTYVRRAGFGRVTGRFQFNKGETFNLFVAGESRPIGVTGQHPFWSSDRNAWVSVRDLRIGERLLVEGGKRVVEKVQVRGEEVVFNIEVEVLELSEVRVSSYVRRPGFLPGDGSVPSENPVGAWRHAERNLRNTARIVATFDDSSFRG